MDGLPTIDSLPDDDIIRVIWWYGPVVKNKTNSEIPLVEVLAKKLLPGDKLSDESYPLKVLVSELDIVKIGSIWKGQSRLDELWHPTEEVEFRFNFTDHTPESIHFLDKRPGEKYGYISPRSYPLGSMPNNVKYHFFNSTLTKLQSNTGVTVLISSLEFLAGAIAPYQKQIRYKLLLHPLDRLTDMYLKSASVDGMRYVVEAKGNHWNGNLTLLAYLRLNSISRKRLSRLFSSVQKSNYNSYGEAYEDRYPEVLPYHPSKMTLSGQGLWIDNDTYLMLRITGVSEPQDYEVQYNKIDLKTNPHKQPTNEGEYKNFSNPQVIDPSELGIDHEAGSSKRAGIAHIHSEVKRLGPPAPVVIVTQKKEIDNPALPPELVEPQEASGLSPEDPNYRQETEGNVLLRQKGPNPSKPALEIFEETVVALKHLVSDPESDVSDFSYISHDAIEVNVASYCFIHTTQLPEGIGGKWHLIKRSAEGIEEPGYTPRAFMVLKIVLDDKRSAYLLEIGRRSKSEAFSGLLFSYYSRSLTQRNLIDLLARIVKYKGRFSEHYQSGDYAPIRRILELPADKYKVFRHRNIQVSLKSAISKAIEQNIFH